MKYVYFITIFNLLLAKDFTPGILYSPLTQSHILQHRSAVLLSMYMVIFHFFFSFLFLFVFFPRSAGVVMPTVQSARQVRYAEKILDLESGISD